MGELPSAQSMVSYRAVASGLDCPLDIDTAFMISDIVPPQGWNLAIPESSRARKAWNSFLLLLLFYTGVVLPFNLAFIDYGVPTRELPRWYAWFEVCVVDVGFYIDLVISFFFTYRDAHDREVFDMARIARRYLKGNFLLNLVACIPHKAFSFAVCAIAGSLDSCTSTRVNQVTRLSRLERVSRMGKMVRLARLGKVAELSDRSDLLRTARRYRGIRVMNQCFALLFVVHLVACGWWVCAALHEDVDTTWWRRREMGTDSTSILQLSEEGKIGVMGQWLVSMYFTLTIFTTVGFGDMSAFTNSEMVYACVAMISGCIVNGVVLSEVISIYTTANEEVQLHEGRKGLIRSFGKHMQVSCTTTEQLVRAICAPQLGAANYDRADMKGILESGILPQGMIDALPGTLFHGRLVRNLFVNGGEVPGVLNVPPRFPIILGLACQSFYYSALQVVYCKNDHAWNVFLVMSGTFSYADLTGHEHQLKSTSTRNLTARMSPDGAAPIPEERGHPYHLFGHKQYFGDLEIILEARPRVATARCESEDGHLLVIHKRELLVLVEEFPLLIQSWRKCARLRSRRRAKSHLRWEKGTYMELAARNLQRNLRYVLMRREGQCTLQHFRCRKFSTDLIAKFSNKTITRRFDPTENVPEYAVRMQDNIESLHEEIRAVQKSFSVDVRDLKADMEDLKSSFDEVKQFISGRARSSCFVEHTL